VGLDKLREDLQLMWLTDEQYAVPLFYGVRRLMALWPHLSRMR
jgi:hypothetical protein